MQNQGKRKLLYDQKTAQKEKKNWSMSSLKRAAIRDKSILFLTSVTSL